MSRLNLTSPKRVSKKRNRQLNLNKILRTIGFKKVQKASQRKTFKNVNKLLLKKIALLKM